MSITKEEFEKKEKLNFGLRVLKFLYTNKNNAYNLKELEEENLVDNFHDFGYLVGVGYINRTKISNVDYYIISEKGVKKLNDVMK